MRISMDFTMTADELVDLLFKAGKFERSPESVKGQADLIYNPDIENEITVTITLEATHD